MTGEGAGMTRESLGNDEKSEGMRVQENSKEAV